MSIALCFALAGCGEEETSVDTEQQKDIILKIAM